eukprot:Gb_18270 [translate_table: standard]
MKSFEVPGFNFFHSLNARDESDEIVFIVANSYPVEHVLERTHLVHSTVEEVRINLSTGIVSRKPLSSKCLEFGVINHKFITKKNRYGYMSVGAPLPKILGVVKLVLRGLNGHRSWQMQRNGTGGSGGGQVELVEGSSYFGQLLPFNMSMLSANHAQSAPLLTAL